ncbi:apolipoprotein A-I-like isoform X2 [Thalassophryne amazonica]|uniref:apolipoprotein A-I-like isoform X2 n=1 Tax=Thalassophryne amazonica TaxID=390379 RepID=UPI001471F1B0|nr:apolipoprotein A-I-like isoform X2 [Thalassophryne amazonica]
MKFLVLALALLLAVGSQAASMKQKRSADPTILQLLRDFVDTFVKHRIQGIKQIEDTFKDDSDGVSVADKLNKTFADFKAWQAKVSPHTDEAFKKAEDFLNPVIEKASAEINSFKTKMEPHRAKLHGVLEKHFEQYKSDLAPIYESYATACKANMEDMKTTLAAKQEEMMKKVSANLEETKSALEPIMSIIQTELTEDIKNFKEQMKTAAQDYIQDMKDAFTNSQGAVDPEAAKKWLASSCLALTS